jgi:23S rRNA C2498 (ribose-2'-O)-methylase RlmM
LLLLRGHTDGWTESQLASRLYVDATTAGVLASDLVMAGLARSNDDTYRYAPADDGIAATVDTLAALYARYMVAIAELIHSSSDRKAQRFADAFRLRKEP